MVSSYWFSSFLGDFEPNNKNNKGKWIEPIHQMNLWDLQDIESIDQLKNCVAWVSPMPHVVPRTIVSFTKQWIASYSYRGW